ncbi:MAG: M4 family metallopeptidase [Thermoanaerobaculales bacterium]|jgi:Zn-dependent metalloprotease|nr:M4 family metallopeptidase [Thermoanaerobaculales bacterium]
MRTKTAILCAILPVSLTAAFAAENVIGPREAAVDALSRDTRAEISLNHSASLVRQARFAAGAAAVDGDTPAEKSELFLLRHGAAFGIDAPTAELELITATTDRIGRTHRTYRQVHRGVEVFGGRIGLHFDTAGELVTVDALLVPDVEVAEITPALSESRAAEAARRVVAKQKFMDPSSLDVPVNRLVIFHDGVIWGRSGRTHLAWEVEITDGGGVNEHLFLDAANGRMLEQISGIEEIHRRVYEHDASNLVWEEGDELPYSGSGGGRDVEINNLIDVAEQTYRTYSNLSGGSFLSYTGTDSTMRSYYDRDGMDCPNAYFNGSSTNYCVGVATDDIIAHEWSHGYTQSTHGLIYAWQPGALNEAYSDIFGETVDLLYDQQGNDRDTALREPGVCTSSNSVPQPELIIDEPASLAGPMETGSASFNPPGPWTVTAELEEADDGSGNTNDGCQELVGFTPGKIALLTMGTCSDRFATAVLNAQDAGAAAAIIINPLNDSLIDMPGNSTTDIPAVLVGKSDGAALRAAVDEPVVATIRLGDAGVGESLRWMIGENSSAFGGAIRDMWIPECKGDPGSVTSPSYYCGEGDNGGVHINSGVPNQAFALLVDGGALNGVDVPAIGLTRAAQIYWRAMSVYQSPLSDFLDHADALAVSCSDLVGAPIPDLLTGEVSSETITPAHCAAVEAAMEATRMRTWPSQCRFDTILDPDAPLQPASIQVFSESFDSAPSDWALSNEGVFDEYVPRNWVWTETTPPGGDGGAFYAADDPMLGNCNAGSNDQSGVVHLESPAIELPMAARPVVLFDHYVATEDRVDGGNLKVSVNGGPFTLVPSEAFLFNPYNDVLRQPNWNDNPLAGEEAFVGTNETTYRGSWGQSQVNLGSMASGGDTIVLRFDFGTDGCGGNDGWYVDNVKVVMEPRQRGAGGRATP